MYYHLIKKSCFMPIVFFTHTLLCLQLLIYWSPLKVRKWDEIRQQYEFQRVRFKMKVTNRISVSTISVRNALELSAIWRTQCLWRAGMLVLWSDINFSPGKKTQEGNLSSLMDVSLSMMTKTNTSIVTLLNCNAAIYSLNLHVILASGCNTGDSYFTLVIFQLKWLACNKNDW